MVHFTCLRKLTDVFSFIELFDLYIFFVIFRCISCWLLTHSPQHNPSPSEPFLYHQLLEIKEYISQISLQARF